MTTMTTNVKVYTLKQCTHCPVLKQMLKNKNIEFEEVDMANAKTMSYLFSKDPGIVSAPVLEIGEKLYTNVNSIERLTYILRLHDMIIENNEIITENNEIITENNEIITENNEIITENNN